VREGGDELSGYLTQLPEPLRQATQAVGEALGEETGERPLSGYLTAVREGGSELEGYLSQLPDPLRQATQAVGEALAVEGAGERPLNAYLTAVREGGSELSGYLTQLPTPLREATQAVGEALAVEETGERPLSGYLSAVREDGSELLGYLSQLPNDVTQMITTLADSGKQNFEGVLTTLDAIQAKAQESAQFTPSLLSGGEAAAPTMTLQPMVDEINRVNETLSLMTERLGTGELQYVTQMLTNLSLTITEVFFNLSETTQQTFISMQESNTSLILNMTLQWKQGLAMMLSRWKTSWESIKETSQTVMSQLLRSWEDTWEGMIKSLKKGQKKIDKLWKKLRDFKAWLESTTFKVKIKADVPAEIQPGSPIRIHTLAKEFEHYLNATNFTFKISAPSQALAEANMMQKELAESSRSYFSEIGRFQAKIDVLEGPLKAMKEYNKAIDKIKSLKKELKDEDLKPRERALLEMELDKARLERDLGEIQKSIALETYHLELQFTPITEPLRAELAGISDVLEAKKGERDGLRQLKLLDRKISVKERQLASGRLSGLDLEIAQLELMELRKQRELSGVNQIIQKEAAKISQHLRITEERQIKLTAGLATTLSVTTGLPDSYRLPTTLTTSTSSLPESYQLPAALTITGVTWTRDLREQMIETLTATPIEIPVRAIFERVPTLSRINQVASGADIREPEIPFGVLPAKQTIINNNYDNRQTLTNNTLNQYFVPQDTAVDTAKRFSVGKLVY
jgi:hypothetical protein